MAPGPVGLRTLAACAAAAAGIELAVAGTIDAGLMGPLAALGWGRAMEAAVFLGIVSWWGGGPGRIGLSAESLLPGLVRGSLWAAVVGLLTAAGFAVLALLEIDPLSLLPVRLPEDPSDRLLLLAVGGIVGPVAEEIFFRGLLYGWLRQWGILPAAGISTAAFVLLHPGGGLVQAAGGLLFAAAYEIEGRLAAPMVIHAAGNLAIFSLPVLLPVLLHP